MRILIIRTFANEVNLDSYNLQEIGLAKALAKKGHVCDVVYYTKGEERTQVVSLGDCEIRIFWRNGIKLFSNAIYRNIVDIAGDYDVIQVAEYDQLQSWKLYKDKSNVVLFHGPYEAPHGGFKGAIKGVLSKLFDRTLSNFIDKEHVKVISKSPLATEFLKTRGFQDIHTFGVGLDTSVYRENSKYERITNNNKYNLLSIGRLCPDKNTLFLLDVVEELLRLDCDINLYLVGKGTGSYAEEVARRIQLEPLSSHVTYLESVPQAELPSLYLSSDLFILPSRYEIFGMVLLEAGYFGCPIVSTLNGGSSQLLLGGDCINIVESCESTVWAQRIAELLEMPAVRSRQAEMLSAQIAHHYTWESLADSYLGVYSLAAAAGNSAVDNA